MELLFRAKMPLGNRTLFSVYVKKAKGKKGDYPYFFVCRGDKEPPPPEEKRPDAVIIVGFIEHDTGPRRLVVTSEFRPAIGAREISFPAGLIDERDYADTNTVNEAVRKAAIREFREETGLELTVTEVSAHNLYSSAGLTNESACIVVGTATGEISAAGHEDEEDIEILPLTHTEFMELYRRMSPGCREYDYRLQVSKVAWPFFRSFQQWGFF